MDAAFWMPIILASLLAGGTSGALGTYIVGMRMSFLGVCVAHAALAGAVFGALAGLDQELLMAPALAGAVATALALGLLRPRRSQGDTNNIMGLLFSLSMGLALLGMGMLNATGHSDHDLRALLWGNLAFCRWRDVCFMLAGGGLLVGFLALFSKETIAILFSCEDALASGIHVNLVWTGFLILTAIIMTVNFQSIGGLMIYSLVANPAIGAFHVARNARAALWWSVLLGITSSAGGLGLATMLNWPAGATVVLTSSLVVLACWSWARWLRRV